MGFFPRGDNRLVRYHVEDLAGAFAAQAGRDQIAGVVDYHDGNDRAHVLRKMAERYASAVVREEDSSTGELRYRTVRTKAAQEAAIKAGLYEVVCRGLTRKIAAIVATLSESSEFAFVSELTGEEDEDFAANMAEERERSGFFLRLSRADELAVLCGSSAILVQSLGGRLSYQPLHAAQLWVVFGDVVEQDGIERPVDTTDLRDASAVIVMLAEGEYVGYFPRSTAWPRGRMVKWIGEWSSPPLPGNEGAWDWQDGEGLGNPLTVHQDATGDYTTPEVPVVIWYGGAGDTCSEIMPVSPRLYEASLEIDLSSSRTSMAANKAARGAWFLLQEPGSAPTHPASFDEGVKSLEPGQSATVLSVPAANVETASKINDTNARYLADEYGVPGYSFGMFSEINATYWVPSGVALNEMNRPLMRILRHRWQVNMASMERLFSTERALMSMEIGEPIGDGIAQVWTIAPQLGETPVMERLAEAEKRIALGLSDKAQALVDTGDFETREEAEIYLATLTQPEPEQPTGLASLRSGGMVRR